MMTEDAGEEAPQGQLAIERPGDLLRHGRKAADMTMADVAARTRVTLRHLEALEANDFAALPSPTYCVGFARAFARAVGIDEVRVAAMVRAELAASDYGSGRSENEMFEPADPARVPPRLLAWGAAAIAALIVIAYLIWRTQMFTPPTEMEAQRLATPPGRSAPVGSIGDAPQMRGPAAAPSGPVVLTANGTVWLRVYEDGGDRLFEGEMASGDSFTVPSGAAAPLILTGRPQALSVTVGGRAVAPLGVAEQTVADLPIDAQSLLARSPTGGAAPDGLDAAQPEP